MAPTLRSAAPAPALGFRITRTRRSDMRRNASLTRDEKPPLGGYPAMLDAPALSFPVHEPGEIHKRGPEEKSDAAAPSTTPPRAAPLGFLAIISSAVIGVDALTKLAAVR